ncbi:hypothetical protein ABEF95_011690 [Exophiala dermatitidis]
MARRGRGGGAKRGPDLSWDDEEDDPSTFNAARKPEPTFPDIEFPVPRPISPFEFSCVQSYLRFRQRAHNGPYYSVLDPSSLADPKTGKVIKRAGFDPFNDQEKYSAKYYKKKQTVPDLSGRDYELKYFPPELWPLLDPGRKHPLWKTTDYDFDAATSAPRKKRKRDIAIDVNEDEENDEANDTDVSDPLLSGTRRSAKAKKRRDDRKAGEKRGLDAEDEFSEEEVQPKPRKKKGNKGSDDEDDEDDNADDKDNDDADDDDDDDGSADDEPVDSEFSESDDGGGDDYNAENYFDTGEGDDEDGFAFGGGRGGDDEGGYF